MFGTAVAGSVIVVVTEVPVFAGPDQLAASGTFDGACCDRRR